MSLREVPSDGDYRAVFAGGVLKMQTLLVALILAAVVGAVFLIARRGYWGFAQRHSDKAHGISGETAIAKFFALFWGWADYNRKDWSSAPYKSASSDFPTTIRMRSD
jgi:hypothetical protein